MMLVGRNVKTKNIDFANITKGNGYFYESTQSTLKYSMRTKKSEQFWLKVSTQRIFKQHFVFEDYLHPLIKYKSDAPIVFDVFIPSLNLALEYNGEQHYNEIITNFTPLDVYKDRDDEKKNIM